MRILGYFADHLPASVPTALKHARAMPVSTPSDTIVLDVVEISPEAVIVQTCQGNALVLLRYFPEVKPLLSGATLNVKV